MTTQDGPARRRGHDDPATRWWDGATQRSYPTTSDRDTLEIHVEDHGHTSILRSIVTTLTGQFGTQRCRFVARVHSADPRVAPSEIASGTFPVLPAQLPLDDIDLDSAFAGHMLEQLSELERVLVEQGWRPAGVGDHWWSKRYTRPAGSGRRTLVSRVIVRP